jgi:hypothetical protein
VNWLNHMFSQSSLKVICLILLLDGSFDVCATCWGDLKCVVVMLERSPPHLFLYLLLFYRKNKKNRQGLYQLKYWRALSLLLLFFILFVYHYYYYYYYYYKFLFYFMCSPNFLSFNINKAKVEFAKINIALIYLHY